MDSTKTQTNFNNDWIDLDTSKQIDELREQHAVRVVSLNAKLVLKTQLVSNLLKNIADIEKKLEESEQQNNEINHNRQLWVDAFNKLAEENELSNQKIIDSEANCNKLMDELSARDKSISDLNITIDAKDKTIDNMRRETIDGFNDIVRAKNKIIDSLKSTIDEKDKTIDVLKSDIKIVHDKLVTSQNHCKALEIHSLKTPSSDKIDQIADTLKRIEDESKASKEKFAKITETMTKNILSGSTDNLLKSVFQSFAEVMKPETKSEVKSGEYESIDINEMKKSRPNTAREVARDAATSALAGGANIPMALNAAATAKALFKSTGAAPPASCGLTSPVNHWYFFADSSKGKWMKYDDISNNSIVSAKDINKFTTTIGENLYKFDMTLRTQTNCVTGKVRRIKHESEKECLYYVNGFYHTHSYSNNVQINSAFVHQQRTIRFYMNGKEYEIDTLNMTQTELGTGSVCKIIFD